MCDSVVIRKGLSILSLFILAVGCTVKQDRTVCPSFLDLTLARQSESVCPDGRASVRLYDNGTSSSFTEPADIRDICIKDTTLLYQIKPRRTVLAFASCNAQPVVESGREYTPYFAAAKEIVCLNETVRDTVKLLHKQYCRLYVSLAESISSLEGSVLHITSGYNGARVPSLAASRGDFSVTKGISKAQTFLIPRQGGEGLSIRFEAAGGVEIKFNLYDFMKRNGYDWYAEDLADFSFILDDHHLDAGLIITDWEDFRFDETVF